VTNGIVAKTINAAASIMSTCLIVSPPLLLRNKIFYTLKQTKGITILGFKDASTLSM